MKPSFSVKFLPLLAAAGLVFGTSSVFAQISSIGVSAPNSSSQENDASLIRFDLDFPGGTPAQFIEAISKAMGKHLNVIVSRESSDANIMPIKVSNATVPELFRAIQAASLRLVPVPTGINAIEYRQVSLIFQTTSDPITNESVWSFQVAGPSSEDLKPKSAPDVCQYFQLAPYLDNYTIEDITTAIQTGWKAMRKKEVQKRTKVEQLKEIDEIPELSFHKETRLLIAVGPSASIAMIPQVLSQLMKDSGPVVEKIARLQAELADIQEKKASGWEKLAAETQAKIDSAAAIQRARQTIDDGGRRLIRPIPSVP